MGNSGVPDTMRWVAGGSLAGVGLYRETRRRNVFDIDDSAGGAIADIRRGTRVETSAVTRVPSSPASIIRTCTYLSRQSCVYRSRDPEKERCSENGKGGGRGGALVASPSHRQGGCF